MTFQAGINWGTLHILPVFTVALVSGECSECWECEEKVIVILGWLFFELEVAIDV